MAKKLLISFILLFILRSLVFSNNITNNNGYQNLPDLEKICTSVVSVHSYISKGDSVFEKIGTGFVISENGFIVTQSSIIYQSDSTCVRFKNGIQKKAWKIYYDDAKKFAILYVNLKKIEPVNFSKEKIYISNNNMFVIGNSLGLFPSLTLSKLRSFDPSSNIIKLEGIFPPGNSGSPVFYSDGTIVGMLIGQDYLKSEKPISMRNIGFALNVDVIFNLFQKIINQINDNEYWAGISVTDIQNFPGVVVFDTAPGSPVENAGITKGDTIIEYQGIPFKNATQLNNLIKNNKNKKIVFTVKRGNKKEYRLVKMSEIPWKKKKHQK